MTEIVDERQRPGYAEITQPVVAEPCGDLIEGKRRTWAEVRTTEQRPGLRTWQIAHCAEVRDAELIAALINAALSSPSEGNKTRPTDTVALENAGYVASRPQEQPRKATPEMVHAAVEYWQANFPMSGMFAVQGMLNAALAVSVSPAAAEGWQDRLAQFRADGWAVAIHNDYWLAGERKTFWLFTHRNGRWVKGEGPTDVAALGKAWADVLSYRAIDAAAPSSPAAQEQEKGEQT